MDQYPKRLEKIKDRPRMKEIQVCNCARCGKTLSGGEECICKSDYEWNQVHGQEELD